jgi:protein-disulfide isomerase
MRSTHSYLVALALGFLSCEVHSVSQKEEPPPKEKPIAAAPAPIYIAPKAPEPPKPPQVPKGPLSPYAGLETAKITLVAFTDYQCPYCGKAETTLKELQGIYGADLRIVWKDLPLVMHKSAKSAAIAARAVGRQGNDKFVAMHTLLFANQAAWSADPALFESYASTIPGLNIEQWRKDLVDPETTKLVETDLALATSLGVNATPTFFINGESLSGAQPITKFQEVAERQKTRADGLLASGIAPEKIYQEMTVGGLLTKPTGIKTTTPGMIYNVPVESFSPTPVVTATPIEGLEKPIPTPF